MIPQATIREAREDDAAAIAWVQVDTWRTAYRGIVDDDFLDRLSYERSAQRIQEAFMGPQSSGWVYVAENDAGEIVGFACGGPERSGDPVYTGELYGIYVLPEYHRRGIGRALTAAIAGRLVQSNRCKMLLWALAANPCRAFYEALGCRVLREQEIGIGGEPYTEVAYVWEDITPLLQGT